MNLFGFHVKLKNMEYIHEKYNVKNLQVFTKSPLSVAKSKITDDQIDHLANYVQKNNIFLVVHGQYLLNFCKTLSWAVNSVVDDLYIIDRIMGVKSKNSGVVIHMGKNTEKNPVEKCFENFVNSIIKILEKTESLKANIILETSCKSDNDLFFRIEQLGKLYKQIPENYRKRVKFCIDTCHVFVSGYDISTLEGVKDFFALFNKEIGLENIVLIHLNDSKVSLGKGTDRHEMIGKGFIFKDNNRSLKEIFRVSKKLKIPMISETHADIEQEIEIIKSI